MVIFLSELSTIYVRSRGTSEGKLGLLFDGATLSGFWKRASSCGPVVIVGGGRWGRVWASVVEEARGSIDDIVMVTRSSADDLSRWLSVRKELHGIRIAQSVPEAFALVPAEAAIISSRPRDHVPDGLAAIVEGAHLLVEKPISHDTKRARVLLDAARCRSRVVCVGTEFAFLPALHECARVILSDDEVLSIRIAWHDPVKEIRYGGIKKRHEETRLLQDLLPHALSIFHVFTSQKLKLTEVQESSDGFSGLIKLIGERGGMFELVCDIGAKYRRRIVDVRTTQHTACIDFSDNNPIIQIDGVEKFISPSLLMLTSTLRLELGAFLTEIDEGKSAPQKVFYNDEQVRVAEEINLLLPEVGSF